MPSQKSRSKEDTWTTDELSKALNKTGERRHHRDDNKVRDRGGSKDEKPRRRKDDDSERRPHRDDDERRQRHRDEDDRVKLTDEERERLRQERREKREGKDPKDKKERKHKEEIQFNTKSDDRDIELNDVNEERRRSHHGDRDRHSRDDRNGKERRHTSQDKRGHRDEDGDKRRRHREEEDEEDERERRRREKRKERESKEEEEKRRRHDDKKDRRRDDDRDRKKDRVRDDRSDKHKDRKEKDRDRDRDKERRHRDRDGNERRETEAEKEERREREREERRKEKEREREERKRKEKEEKPKEEEEGEDDYEEDFEDYEEDFEEDDDDDDDDVAGNHVEDSEVNDVLKALDAENAKLTRELTESPQIQRNYGRDRRSNDDADSDDDVPQAYQSRQERPKTAINFVSAKQRAMSRKTNTKTMQRMNDLLKMIELDVASFDILDMPPVNEYDLYIRAFGNSNTRQAYIQTNDDNVDRDIQTEEVDMRSKWTQYPSDTFNGCGRGDGEKDLDEEEEDQMKVNHEEDMGRLGKFLKKAGQVVAMLLDEEKEQQSGEKGGSKSHIGISDSFTQIDLLPILEGRHVVYSHFSPVQPNLLLTAYSSAPEVKAEDSMSRKGIICVWNTHDSGYPQKILVCSSQPRCCCFSPVKPSLVFAGMVDGSIAIWDLRESASLHTPTVVNEEEYCLRYPTYDTAGVLTEENHHSPVCSISPVYSYISSPLPTSQQSQASDDSSGLSFQLVSIEESAVLHFWVVAELGSSDDAGSQNDLGLAPGGKVKILKSSTLTLENPSRNELLKGQVRALDMTFSPSDPNQVYVSTDSGVVIHGVRFGNRAFPKAHAPVIETIVDVVSIDFSPFEQPCFLAGCSDGSFSLYHTKSEHPLITWPQVTHGKPVLCIKWSRSRPCVFFVLDKNSTLYIFDLLEGDLGPKQVETISQEKVVSFSLTNDHKATGLGLPGKEPQMLFSLEGGRTEIHTISKALTEPEQLETDFLASYLQRF